MEQTRHIWQDSPENEGEYLFLATLYEYPVSCRVFSDQSGCLHAQFKDMRAVAVESLRGLWAVKKE